jgi:hypothetical protein
VSKRILMGLFMGMALAGVACARKKAPAPAPAASDLVTDKALVDGHLVEIAHSKWDSGQTSDLFDTDPRTLARTENANPAILEFRLTEPRPLKGISITLGGTDFAVTATVQPQAGAAKTYTREFRQMKPDPTLDLDFDTGGAPIAALRVEIQDLRGGDGHIHIRTVKLL